MILKLHPYGSGNAPLAALTAAMKSEVTHDPIFHWFTKDVQDFRFKLGADLSGGNAAGTQQTITLDASTSAFSVKENDILMSEHTGELLFVQSTPTQADQIVVLRGFENSVSVAVDYDGDGVNPYLKKIGSAYEEGSAAPDPIGWDPEELSNQTQIFREAYALTRTAMKTRTRTGDEVRESKADCLEAFTVGMESAFIWGKRRTTTRNGQPLRLTDGIIAQLPAERKVSLAAYNGQISLSYYESLVANIFRYGSREKMAFVGLTGLLAITQMIRRNGQLQWSLSEGGKEYGMDVQRLRTPAGTLVLKVHPMFGQMQGGYNGPNNVWFPGFDNAMLILDMANLKYRYLEGSDVTYQPNMQLPGTDGMLAGYLAECGLEMHHPETHMLVTGIREGVADQ